MWNMPITSWDFQKSEAEKNLFSTVGRVASKSPNSNWTFNTNKGGVKSFVYFNQIMVNEVIITMLGWKVSAGICWGTRGIVIDDKERFPVNNLIFMVAIAP
jgi:hypothetical protein